MLAQPWEQKQHQPNIFMAEIDTKIQNCALINQQTLTNTSRTPTNTRNPIQFYKRFIEDIFIIWTGTKEEFSHFMEKINTYTRPSNLPVNSTIS
jgi:hypothetical protein